MTSLLMQGITKTFPGVVANADVDFQVVHGEIHALVGENGAGKSTLMKILYGMEQYDAGKIFLDGKQVNIPNPHAAIKLGIGMVHQHFQLIPSLTVAENVALGFEPRRGFFVDRQGMLERVRQLSETFGLKVDPSQRIADLSVGVRQRVEILKLLYRDAKLLILDEPSAVLTPQEVATLFEVIRRLVSEGRTTILITHKLHEVMSICQRATVLRRGRVVGTVDISETNPAEIARMMVGADVGEVKRTTTSQPRDVVLAVKELSSEDERGLPALRGVTFDIRGGEILGLVGVEGNGQQELLEVLMGLRPVTTGMVQLNNVQCTHQDNRWRREQGLALIPEDRHREGLSSSLTLWENIAATRYYQTPQSHYGVMNIGRLQQTAKTLMEKFDVRASSHKVALKTLSGGNAQKVVIARELAGQPKVLIAAQPTRGLDVGAAGFVHERLLELRAVGVGILLVSADLDELLSICDRFIVLFEGSIVGALTAEEATREKLGLLMAGRTSEG